MKWPFFKKNDDRPAEAKEQEHPKAGQPKAKIARLQTLYEQLKPFASSLDTGDIYNAELKDEIRIIRKIFNSNDSASIDTHMANIVRLLHRSLLLLPYSYDDGTHPSPKELHATMRAAYNINENSILYRVPRMKPEQVAKLGWVLDEHDVATIDTTWWDVSRFAGGEGCEYASESSGKKIVPFTFNTEDGKLVIAGYTGMDTLTQSMDAMGLHGEYGIAVYTFNDFVHDFESAPGLAALIVDMRSPETHCYLSRSVLHIDQAASIK